MIILSMLFALSAHALSLESPAPAPAPVVAGPMQCNAIYRNIINGQYVEKRAEVPVIFEKAGIIKYGVDLEGKYLGIDIDQNTGSYLGFITTAPDYTKGPVSRGAPDPQGNFNISEVDNAMVHRLECKKKTEQEQQPSGSRPFQPRTLP